MKNLILILLASLVLFSCEDKVDISKTLKSGENALVVDAFLNNLKEKQVVRLSSTQYYFDNSGPKLISGAKVSLTDLSTQQSYVFSESILGEYQSELNGDSLLKVGHEYQLSISHVNENYVAYSMVNRVVRLDSITFEMAEEPDGTKVPGRFEAELWANDFPGPGDRYWVRHYKNNVRSIKPANLGIGYDASSFPAGEVDGIPFIFPLRRFYINETLNEKKWKMNDVIKVEVYSITNEAAFFLAQVLSQSSLGEGGAIGALFAIPPSNVPTNIKNTNENGNKAVGFFCTSAVSVGISNVPNKAINIDPF